MSRSRNKNQSNCSRSLCHALAVTSLSLISSSAFAVDKQLSSRDYTQLPRADYLHYVNQNDEGGVAGINCTDCSNDDVNMCQAGCVECNIDGVFCDCAEEALPTGGPCDSTSDCSQGLICCTNCGTAGLCVIPCGQACFDTTDCDDGNACTSDICQNNLTCTHEFIDCADDSPCTIDFCDTVIGCQHPLRDCDDMDNCTLNGCDEITGDCVFTQNCCMTNDDCDDNNSCPNDTCDMGTGMCVFNNPPCSVCNDNSDCNDGSNCTQDLCTGGFCENPLTCVPIDPACFSAACINDMCDLVATNCDDGNPCTEDSCMNGCIHTPIVGCGGPECVDDIDCDDSNDCSIDTCDMGTCVRTPTDVGCDDGNPCTTNDACVAGICVGTEPTNCDDGDPCTVDTCEEAGGVGCVNTPTDCECVTDDQCNDGTECTSEFCNNGTCSYIDYCAEQCGGGETCCADTTSPGCSDVTCCESVCSYDGFCCDSEWDAICVSEAQSDPNCGCVGCGDSTNNCCTASPDASPSCSDETCCESVCLGDSFCCETEWDGLCAEAAEFDPNCNCGFSDCGDSTNDCCSVNGTPSCSDESCCECVCNIDPFCCETAWDEFCVPIAACNCADDCGTCGLECCADTDCDDGSACTHDYCDAGICLYDPITGGTAGGAIECDGNLCTVDDSCNDGVCNPGMETTSCPSDPNPCMENACNPLTGLCESTPLDGVPCSDGNPCTQDEMCVMGTCTSPAVDCDDGIDCTVDTCDAMLGCLHTADNTTCDDGLPCTADVCCGGDDSPGECLKSTGCINPPVDGGPAGMVECDGNLCTLDDSCNDGVCIPGTMMMGCPADANPCTDEVCNPMTGLCEIVNDNTNLCSDNSACTTMDACVNGVCIGSVPPNCDDGFACTTDTCSALAGCMHTPNNAACDDGDACTTDICDLAVGCVNPCTDEIDPVPTGGCPAAMITVECDQPVPPFDPAFTDNCDPMLQYEAISTIAPGNCPQEESISRSKTAIDSCGNSTTCSQVVSVVDTTPPVVTNCPEEVTYECSDPFPGFDPVFTDNCDTMLVPTGDCVVSPGKCLQESATSCIRGVADDCGNPAICETVFYKVDTTPPVVTCQAVVVARCNSDGGVPVNEVWVPDGQAIDNCDESVPVSDNRPTEGVYPVSCDGPGTFITFTAEDDCGNVGTCVTEVRVTGGMCCPTITDTDLKLLATDLDLRQDTDGPTTTKARFDVWNQNEVRFSGTERCITCWDETLISNYLAPHLLLQNLQTDKGKARIQNEASTVCPESSDSALLGVAIREYQFLGDPNVSMRSAVTLVGMGEQEARIQYDPPSDTEEAFGGDSGFTISDIVDGNQQAADNPRSRSFNAGAIAGGGVSPNRASTTAKGSLIIWPVIEVKWDAYGTLIQDTFITVLNDFPADVEVQFYQVNGDAPLDPVFDEDTDDLIERAHPGWNNSDYKIRLTDDESAYWSVATGWPKGVSPLSVLDPGNPNGRPDPDPSNPGGRVIRGFLLAWAVNVDGEEIRWNHLKGHAVGVRYDQGTTFDYSPWSFAVVSGVPQGAQSDGDAGSLRLDGSEYDYAPETLLFDFFAAGSQAMSHPDVRE